MVDFFVLFEVPRSPWLDEEELKSKYHARALEIHPDRFHGAPPAARAAATATYTQWNTAYQVLSDPKDRLQHLLELERGTKPAEVQQVPNETMEAGMKIAQLCRDADNFLASKAKISSPLLLANTFEAGQARVDQLQAWMRELESRQNTLLEAAKRLAPAWSEAASMEHGGARPHPLPLERLEEIFRQLSYLKRWREQLNARVVALSL